MEWCARQQIAIANRAKSSILRENRKLGDQTGYPGTHEGYDKLCKVLAEQERWNELHEIAARAQSETWVGDWDKWLHKAAAKLSAS